METLKIESGKFYRTRGGRKARIYATDAGGNYSIHGAVCLADETWRSRTWKSDGTYSIGDVSDSDIISEWEQTIDDIGFDKSCLPKWAKFIFMDEGGKWYWCDAEPVRTVDDMGEYWEVHKHIFGIIPTEHAPKNYQGDWKDSLFEIK